MIHSLRSRRALLLAGGCCSSLLAAAALPSEALAQTTDPNQLPPPVTTATTPAPGDPNAPQPSTAPGPDTSTNNDTGQGAIVVTGIRGGIRSSINIKRKEESIVEAISAEDIGKLPDVSVAESIARLPGLAAQRVAGRAQIVSVRGFSPDFTTVLLNGRQQASSGVNRGVEFDQYPSELLGSVVVYKSPDASIAGMGLAGTVDLRTVRPISFGKQAIALNLRGEYDQGGGRNHELSKYGWRGSASYIDQNEDGTLGWAIGYAHLDAPSHTNRTQNWFYDNYAGLLPDGTPYILSGAEIFAKNRREIRDGVMGTVEWQPSDRVHSLVDLYYSRFKQHEVSRGAQWFADAWVDGVTYDNLQTQNIDGHDYAVSGTAHNIIPILRNDDNRRTDKLFSAGWNTDWQMFERTHLIGDLSYSSNKRDETYIETYGGYGVGPSESHTAFDSYNFEIPRNDFPQFTGFGLDYADANNVSLGDRAPWGGWGHDGLSKSPHVKETVTAADGTIKQELGGFFTSLEAGLNYTHRHKDKTVDEFDLMLKNNRDQTLVSSEFLGDPTSLGFAGFGDVLGVDIADALDTYYDQVVLLNSDHYDKSWDIKEDILTFKAKANIESGDLHGNVGVQVVQQKQKSSGLRINGLDGPLQLSDVSVTKKYTDFLPSLNLSYDLDRHNKLRFAAAKVMARPRMDDMRANLVPGFNGSICAGTPPCTPGQVVHPWSASGGNPNLKPWRAKELDVAYEWYGDKATYFSVNAFYMHVDSYIYNQLIPGDFSAFPLPPSASGIPSNVVISPIGTINAPANGQGGKVYGVEVSGAVDFGSFAKWLDGFGAIGSVSYSKSKLKTEAATQLDQLPGFSKWVYNATGYYEKNGFQARASYRYRSKFKGEVVGLFTNPDFPFILADKQLDAQVGYTFPKGTKFENLGVLLQVNNLLNSPYRTTMVVNGTQFLNVYEEWGSQWLLGVNYKF